MQTLDLTPMQANGRYHAPLPQAAGGAARTVPLPALPRAGDTEPPSDQTGLPAEAVFHRIVTAVERLRPARAAELVARRARVEQVLAAREQARAALRDEHARLEARKEALLSQAEAAARPHAEAAKALEPALSAALSVAIGRTSRICRPFDPQRPEIAPLLVVERTDRGVIAAREKLPEPSRDAGVLFSSHAAWAMTGLVGVLTGVSLGVASGVLQPDTLLRHPVPLALAAGIGVGLAAFARKAIVAAHRYASERGYLGRPWEERAGLLAAALGLDAAVILVDLFLQREGLLRWMNVNAGLSGEPARGGATLAFLVIPLAVTLGYVVYSAYEGALEGRRGPLEDRISEAEEREHRRLRELHEARPEVQGAVAAVQAYRALREQQATHRQDAEFAADPYRKAAEAGQPQERQQAELRRAENEFEEARSGFRTLLEQELERIEPGGKR